MGAAPDVPPNAVSPLPVPASADIDAPGAPISGLMCWLLIDGPRDELATMPPTSGNAAALEMDTLTTPEARRALMAVDSDCWMTSEGLKFVPPPKENETASPPATSPMRTPVAPSLTALSTFKLTEHPPRSISATLPDGLVRTGSAGLPAATLPAGQPRP